MDRYARNFVRCFLPSRRSLGSFYTGILTRKHWLLFTNALSVLENIHISWKEKCNKATLIRNTAPMKIRIIFYAFCCLARAAFGVDSDTLRLILPSKSWTLEMSFKGFEVQKENFLPDFQGRMLQAENSSNQLIMSVFLVPAEKKITATEYRDIAFENLQKTPFKFSNVKKYEKDGKAFTDYIVQDVQEFKNLNQKNICMYIVKDNTWIDLHFSKVNFKEGDQKILDEIVNSVKIVEPSFPSSMENFIFGSYFYRQKKYGSAKEYYQKVFEQEKQKTELSDELFLVLIDNLGMACGIPGDLKAAQQIFEYGISKKPTYPMFYYNLACTFAESGNLDQTIQNLKQAFKYKENMIKGEAIPNPKKDSSFEKYLNDQRFKDFLMTIGL